MSKTTLPERPEQEQAVTLEDLLRLKRHEQPPTEFWVRFDRELEQRTLQALVKHRPSFISRLAALFVIPRRVALPATASAILVAGIALHSIQAPVAKLPAQQDSIRPLAAVNPVAEPDAEAAIAPQEDIFGGEAMLLADSRGSSANAHFVVDVLSADQGNDTFRKVMAGESFSLSTDGVRYVADPLSAGASRVLASTPSFQHF